MTSFATEIIVGISLLIGAGFMLIGSIGLIKLPDFYTRLHAPTKATTLGIGALLLASMIYFSFGDDNGVRIQELIISLFLFITAPISAMMISKAAIHRDIKTQERTYHQALQEDIRARRGQED